MRRTLPKKTKVGHAGTLDPFATGLLLVLVGKATRAQQFLMALPKTYRAVARLGWTSTTGDPEGELSQTGRIPDDPQIPTGDLMQRPHAYSAVKVGGRRAYELARAGRGARAGRAARDRLPRRAARRSTASAPSSRSSARPAPTSASSWPRSATPTASSSSARRSATFRLEDADPERVVPLDEALAFLPERALDEDEADGRRARPPRRRAPIDGPTRLTADGELIAIGRPRDGEIQPDVVFVP